jgi:hypothetical protein
MMTTTKTAAATRSATRRRTRPSGSRVATPVSLDIAGRYGGRQDWLKGLGLSRSAEMRRLDRRPVLLRLGMLKASCWLARPGEASPGTPRRRPLVRRFTPDARRRLAAAASCCPIPHVPTWRSSRPVSSRHGQTVHSWPCAVPPTQPPRRREEAAVLFVL